MAAAEQQMTKALAPLPAQAIERGIDRAHWNTLKHSLFPGAQDQSIALVWDYCKARQLDPMKKPCHIVPMDVKQGENYVKRDVVMPGIYEYRTTAMRTNCYMGYDKPEYGPMLKAFGVEAPEWCEFTVYRWHEASKTKIPFSARVYFREVVGTKWAKGQQGVRVANDRWERAPIQMMTKTAEAAALRAAFPDELGGEPVMEEIDGQSIRPEGMDAVDDVDPLGTALAELSDEHQALAAEVMSQSKMTKGQLTALFLKHGKDVVPFMLDLGEQVQKQQSASKKPADVRVKKVASMPTVDLSVSASVQRAKVAEPQRPAETVETPSAGEIF